MKTITKEYKVFNFEELAPDVQQEVIDKWYEGEDYPFLEDDISEELLCIDEHKVFIDPELSYSLSWCQGDGLSIKGSLDLKNFLDHIYSKRLSPLRVRALCEYVYSVHSKGNTRHYCYAAASDIEYDYNYQPNKECPRLEKLFDQVLEEVQAYYLDVCARLEKYGYAELEYRMSIDEFIDHCDSNEYNFLENGKMVNY